jgi:RNA polymerase sigma factor (sigma-70 family)
VSVVSFDEPRGEGITLHDAADAAVEDEDPFRNEGLREALERAMEALTLDEQSILMLRYDEGLTHKEIGEIYGFSESNSSQICGRACRKLAEHEELRDLAA